MYPSKAGQLPAFLEYTKYRHKRCKGSLFPKFAFKELFARDFVVWRKTGFRESNPADREIKPVGDTCKVLFIKKTCETLDRSNPVLVLASLVSTSRCVIWDFVVSENTIYSIVKTFYKRLAKFVKEKFIFTTNIFVSPKPYLSQPQPFTIRKKSSQHPFKRFFSSRNLFLSRHNAIPIQHQDQRL